MILSELRGAQKAFAEFRTDDPFGTQGGGITVCDVFIPYTYTCLPYPSGSGLEARPDH
jgi:hypothetical protein